MVTSFPSKSPFRSGLGDSFCKINKTGSPAYNVSFTAGEVKLPVTVTSYRSGPGYDRALRDSGIPYTPTRGELIASLAGGDTGHPYLKKAAIKASASLKMYSALGQWQADTQGSLLGYAKAGSALQLLPDDFSWIRSDASLKTIGDRFVHDTNPLMPAADLLVSIAELMKEGLPSPLGKALFSPGIKKRGEAIQRLGSEYLNFVFGVKPIISDARRILSTAGRVDAIVNQWVRDNQRTVRRRRRVPTQVTSTNLSSSGQSSSHSFLFYVPARVNSAQGNIISNSFNPGFSNWSQEAYQVVKEKLTFSAAFDYDIEKLLPLEKRDDFRASKLPEHELRQYLELNLLGLNIDSGVDPSLVWALMPWSWLIDWFVNVGDLLDNFRARQSASVHTQFAYVKSVQERWIKSTDTIRTTGNVLRSVYRKEFYQLYVRRLKATPFGFNTDFGSLSGSQTSILAAIAATR